MSLIPSESASFPDLLGRGLDASKKSKWRESALPEVDVKPVMAVQTAKAELQKKAAAARKAAPPAIENRAVIPENRVSAAQPSRVSVTPKAAPKAAVPSTPAPAPVVAPATARVAAPVAAPVPAPVATPVAVPMTAPAAARIAPEIVAKPATPAPLLNVPVAVAPVAPQPAPPVLPAEPAPKPIARTLPPKPVQPVSPVPPPPLKTPKAKGVSPISQLRDFLRKGPRPVAQEAPPIRHHFTPPAPKPRAKVADRTPTSMLEGELMQTLPMQPLRPAGVPAPRTAAAPRQRPKPILQPRAFGVSDPAVTPSEHELAPLTPPAEPVLPVAPPERSLNLQPQAPLDPFLQPESADPAADFVPDLESIAPAAPPERSIDLQAADPWDLAAPAPIDPPVFEGPMFPEPEAPLAPESFFDPFVSPETQAPAPAYFAPPAAPAPMPHMEPVAPPMHFVPVPSNRVPYPGAKFQPFVPVEQFGGFAPDPGLDEPLPWPDLVSRRREKLIRFLVIEGAALGLLIMAAFMALKSHLDGDWVGAVAKILTIVMAIAIAVVPILFYGLPDTLPRSRR